MATTEERVAQVEERMDALRSDVAELKGMVAALAGRIGALGEKVDQRFLWLFGVQVATLLAIVAGLFGIVTNLV